MRNVIHTELRPESQRMLDLTLLFFSAALQEKKCHICEAVMKHLESDGRCSRTCTGAAQWCSPHLLLSPWLEIFQVWPENHALLPALQLEARRAKSHKRSPAQLWRFRRHL